MDEAMTHETCSELLAGYVRGELPPAQAEEVRTHLAGCDECRAEERAVAALTATEVRMDDVERARLHRGLAQELFAARANADVAGAAPAGGRREWTRWIAPALASAAVLAGVLVVATGNGTDDAAELSIQDPDRSGEQESGLDSAEGGGAAHSGKPGRTRALSGAASSEESAYDLEDAGPQPVFVANAGALDARELSATGRTGEPFASFVKGYLPGDARPLYEPFLRSLASVAGDAGPQVEECAATLPQDGTLLPAYGALARYEGEDALVLGFVTSDPGSERFDRYLMWVWARGSCRQPIDTLFEHVDGR